MRGHGGVCRLPHGNPGEGCDGPPRLHPGGPRLGDLRVLRPVPGTGAEPMTRPGELLQAPNGAVPVLAMRDVAYSYGSRRVLYDINLTLHQGQLLGLIGPNGSGKTTLLKIALGIIRPHKGRVYWFGRDTTGRGPGPQVGYVPQNLQVFTPDFPATAAEVVATGLVRTGGLGGWWSRRDREAVEAALDLVGLAPLAHHRVSRTSGGERQRVFIARALVNRPQVLLLDERSA